MGEGTKIEWAHHTFNPWEGCTKVSPGCANCYAETRNKRLHAGAHWGPRSARLMRSEAYWREPRRWNAAAAAAGERHRVFCASLADVFEDRPELVGPRERLFDLIYETRSLDWLVLTKRPDRMADFLLGTGSPRTGVRDAGYFRHVWPNLWCGTTVEDQPRAEERIPQLLRIPAVVRFLSCEPLLGPVDLRYWLKAPWMPDFIVKPGSLPIEHIPVRGVEWVIAGGESGPGARPMHPAWVSSLRDQCAACGVPFLFKQWGEWAPAAELELGDRVPVRAVRGADSDLEPVARVGKRAAGRELDGRTWDELPEVARG